MKINFDRICRLAGVESKRERKARLTEGVHGHVEEYDEMAMDYDEMAMEEDEIAMEEYDEMAMEEDDLHRLDEVVEVDPRVLMEEIRRAKKIKVLKENRMRSAAIRQQRLQENHLKRVIRQEIQNIVSEIDEVDSSWVYGRKKPRHSRKGYTNHGRTMPGIGFDKKW